MSNAPDHASALYLALHPFCPRLARLSTCIWLCVLHHLARRRFTHVQRLGGSSSGQVYLCEDEQGHKRVAKLMPVCASQYPTALHDQLWQLGLTPQLLNLTEHPGGFTLLEVEYLNPRDGWLAVGGA